MFVRKIGIDLGTADVVAIAVDHAGEPAAAFLEWADVVRDGVVLDYWGAIGIVKSMMAKITARVGREITSATTAYPPGTDPYSSINVLQAAGLRVNAVVDRGDERQRRDEHGEIRHHDRSHDVLAITHRTLLRGCGASVSLKRRTGQARGEVRRARARSRCLSRCSSTASSRSS